MTLRRAKASKKDAPPLGEEGEEAADAASRRPKAMTGCCRCSTWVGVGLGFGFGFGFGFGLGLGLGLGLA